MKNVPTRLDLTYATVVVVTPERREIVKVTSYFFTCALFQYSVNGRTTQQILTIEPEISSFVIGTLSLVVKTASCVPYHCKLPFPVVFVSIFHLLIVCYNVLFSEPLRKALGKF